VQTDSQGRFVIQAFENVTYRLRAIGDSADGSSLVSDQIEIKATKDLAPIRIRIKAPR
jgi:hypothetical protein